MQFNEAEKAVIADIKIAARKMNDVMKRADRLGLSVIANHAAVPKSDGTLLRQLNVRVAHETVICNVEAR